MLQKGILLKKNNFSIILLVFFIIFSHTNFPVYATNSNDNEIQPYMPVQNYDDDFLEAYQETVEFTNNSTNGHPKG